MRILVTGASGFIGRALCSLLVADGHEVLGLCRSDPGIAGVEFFAADLTAAPDLVLPKLDKVFHLAGAAHHYGLTADALRAANVTGTTNIIKAARLAGAERLVFTSSIKVLGEESLSALPADAALKPADDYARSKVAAERVVQAASDLAPVVLRFPLVYGPGVKGNMAALVALARQPWPLPFASVNKQRDYLGIDNLVDFMRLALDPAQVPAGTYHLTDGQPLSLAELVSQLRRAAGRAPLLLPVPVLLLKGLSQLVLGRERTDKLLGGLVLDTSETVARTGWHPPIGLAAGIEKMVNEGRISD